MLPFAAAWRLELKEPADSQRKLPILAVEKFDAKTLTFEQKRL
jgi:hypothetical protein